MDFQYEPLESAEHIRVLVLQPADDVNEPLKFSMSEIHLKDRTIRYECISYAWRGGQIRDHDLFCEEKILRITANLASALRRFRSRHRSRVLWADAICINQTDEVEKSGQIPIMWQIFSNALCVRVWLGEEGVEECKAVQDIAWRNAEREPFLSDDAKSLRKFFGLPWFGRRWVVQEVVLNTDVVFYCGSTKMTWPALHNAYQRIPGLLWSENGQETVRDTLMQLGHLWLRQCYSNRYGSKIGLWNLLESLSHMQCIDNKDRIYAFAGLADDVHLESASDQPEVSSFMFSLTSNYGCSDAKLFGSVTMPRLQSSTLLYCTLAYAGAHRCLDGERRFASWIPDFSLPKLWAVDPIHDRTYLGPSSVSEGDDGGLVLRIQAQSWRDTTDSPSPGWCPNHVTGLFPRAMSQDPTTAIKMFDDLRRWLHLLAPDADEFVERYVRTIVTGIMSQIDWRSPGDLTVYDIEDQALAAAKTWIFNKKDQNELEGPPPAVLDPLFHAIACRCFFVGRLVSYRQYNSNQERTSRFIGFGPSDLRVGDEFIASSACGKALFFRSVAGGHELLGGGYARLPVTGAEPPPRHEVTFHIV